MCCYTGRRSLCAAPCRPSARAPARGTVAARRCGAGAPRAASPLHLALTPLSLLSARVATTLTGCYPGTVLDQTSLSLDGVNL